MIKKCPWCSKEFTTTRNNKIFCCKQCKIYNVRKNVVLRSQVIIEKECEHCHKSFTTSNKTYKYCCHNCRYPKKHCSQKDQSQSCVWCHEDITYSKMEHVPFCCSRCEESSNLGNNSLIDYCTQCHREYHKTHGNVKFCSKRCSRISSQTSAINTLTDIKQKLLQTDKCTKCQNSYPAQCLAFHHLHDKKFNLSKTNYPRFSDEEILKEIKKTQILCHNCHAEIHYYKHIDEKKSNIKQTSIYKEKIRRNRKKTLVDLLGASCICCGLKSDIMDIFTFDHIAQKRFNLSKSELGSRKWSDILDEVQNCQLLCQNCHQLKNILPVHLRNYPINLLLGHSDSTILI